MKRICNICGKQENYHAKGMCKSCYYKQYREKNIEYHRERSNQWKEENKERVKEYIKEWRNTNQEQIQEYQKNYYEEHKEEILENVKMYYQNHKEEKAKYNKIYKHTPIGKLKHRQDSHRRKGYDSILLFDNIFDDDVNYHHISDGFVVALPIDIHKKYYTGEKIKHRELLKPIVEELYEFTYVIIEQRNDENESN